jgi:hypothetical protein
MPEKNCPHQTLMQEFLDSPKSPELAAQLHKHMAECESCRQEFAGFQQLFQSLDRVLRPPPLQPTPQQIANIKKTVVAKSDPKKTQSAQVPENLVAFFFKPFAIAGLILLTLGSFVFFKNQQGTGQLPVEQPLHASLDLAQNSVSLIFSSSTTSSAFEGENAINVAELKAIKPETSYQLPKDCSILLRSHENSILLSKKAKFALTTTSFELHNGEAHFKLSGPHQNFKLLAGPAEVSVIGTEFVIQNNDDQLTITLISGHILVKTKSGAIQQLVTPGQIQVRSDGTFFDSQPSAPEQSFPDKTHESVKPDNSKSSGDSGRKLENSF